MNQKELKELIEYLIQKDIAEFELERGDVKVRIKRGSPERSVETRFVPVAAAEPGAYVPVPAAPHLPQGEPTVTSPGQAPPEQPAQAQQPEPSPLHTVKSPIVGTFYEAASPGAPAFVKAGDTVEVGQVLCIIEAMKLMNEIESDVAGEIVTCHAKNAQPIEYGQPLFEIRLRQ